MCTTIEKAQDAEELSQFLADMNKQKNVPYR